MVHADGPRTWGTEAGGSQFDGTLGSIDTVSKTSKKKTRRKWEAVLSEHGNCEGGPVSSAQPLAGNVQSCVRTGQGWHPGC